MNYTALRAIAFSTVALAAITNAPLNACAADAPKAQFLNSPQALTLDRPFSEAVRAGDWLILAGQLGSDEATGKVVPGGIGPESRAALQHIKKLLESNGASMADVVKCTVFFADIAEWGDFNKVYREFFSKPFPARSALGANGLALNARVEVECLAYQPQAAKH